MVSINFKSSNGSCYLSYTANNEVYMYKFVNVGMSNENLPSPFFLILDHHLSCQLERERELAVNLRHKQTKLKNIYFSFIIDCFLLGFKLKGPLIATLYCKKT